MPRTVSSVLCTRSGARRIVAHARYVYGGPPVSGRRNTRQRAATAAAHIEETSTDKRGGMVRILCFFFPFVALFPTSQGQSSLRQK